MRKTEGKDLEVRSINIENFRCINQAEIEFDPNITILVGRNGSGKTSVLDAIALGLQNVQIAWEYATKSRSLPRPERIDASDINGNSKHLLVDLLLNTSLKDILGQKTIRFRNHSENSITNESFSHLVSAFSEINTRFHKPLFLYYGQGRAFENGRSSRQAALSQDSLNGDLRAISNLEEWWNQRDAEEARTVRDTGQADFRDPQLEAIRSLVRRIEGFRDIFYSSTLKQQGLYFRKLDNATVHVSRLSSGEKSYIILLADLARRLQLSSLERDIASIPGIVLIDEIELNLHPAWQSEIVPTIRQVFPSCQFIITTHSPQVISGVESSCIRVLRRTKSGGLSVSTPLSTRGRSSNYLLEGVFEAFERLPEVDNMIHDFNEAIDKREPQRAAGILERLTQAIEGDPSDLLVFKKRLKKLWAENEGR
jgi:predicted ATP-binding protein involved in virulence